MGIQDVDPEAALNAMNGGEQSEDQAPPPEAIDDAPDPESDDSEQRQTTAEAQAIADLSKFKEFTIDGQKMTYDELKELRANGMRQADYTRKTQELAEERKFNSNLRYDLDAVRKNPSAAAAFRQIYPKQYHPYLDFVLSQSTTQTPQTPGQAPQALPPEIEERLSRFEQVSEQFMQDKLKAEQDALGAHMEAIEQKMSSKYKYADKIVAYTLAEQHKEKLERETGQKITAKDITEQFLEPFFKASHDYQMKQYNLMKKELATKAKSVHAQASDIGRGGGTPDSPPEKLNFRKGGVADYILGGGEV